MEFHKGLPYAAVGWNSLARGEFRHPIIPSAGRLRHRVNRIGKPVRQLLTRETHEHDLDKLNRVQFETRRFQFRSSPSGRPWKVGTTGFKLDAV
jgi:hypothetical protein